MYKMTHGLRAVAVFSFVLLGPMVLARAGELGCTLSKIAGTPGQVIRCQKGLTITVEADARFTLLDRDSDGNADAVALRRNALLIDETTGDAGSKLQIVTPQAILAVRGTKWAVDVQKNKTSVFVIKGHVDVRRPAAKDSVVLGPGEGVDVEAGKGPLTVRRWPAARVSALLARFGQ